MIKVKISPKRRFLTVFVLVNLFLSVFFIDKCNNWNSVSRALPIMAYFEQGNFQLDKYHHLTGDISYINGHYYTDKAPMVTMLVFPFYKALVTFGLITRHNSEADLIPINILAGILAGSVPFTLLLFMLMKALLHLKNRIPPVVFVMLPLYGSFLYVFSGTFFSHLLAGMFILFAYTELKKSHFFMAGISAGMAFATEFPLGIFIPIWALIILWREKSFRKAVIFSLGTLPLLLFIFFYNYYFTGSPFTMLYKYEAIAGFAEEFNKADTIFGFGIPRPENIWDMLFGQYKEIYFYLYVLFLLCIHIYIALPDYRKWNVFKSYLIIPVVMFMILIVSKSISWWGGWTYDPRYLIPACMIIVYEGLIFLSDKKFNIFIFYILSIFGLFCAWMAKATVVTGIPSDKLYPVFEYVATSFRNKNFNPNNILSMLFNVSPHLAAYLWVILFAALIYWLIKEYSLFVKRESLFSNG